MPDSAETGQTCFRAALDATSRLWDDSGAAKPAQGRPALAGRKLEDYNRGMSLRRREFLAGGTLAIFSRATLAAEPVFRPEDFGALGNGIANDTSAFRRLAAEVNRRGGGVIALRPERTYVVGSQLPAGERWRPAPILEFSNLGMPLVVRGNGARLVAQAGLRFGTFDPRSGKRVDHALPYLDQSDLAFPYRAMIFVRDCRAAVQIRDLELDGNLAELRIGGRFGDTGWQVPATGLLLTGNRGVEIVGNVYTHDHGQDGAMFIGDAARAGRGTVTKLVSRRNGRQGLSITGGRGYDLVDCEFSQSARGRVSSAPAAGVDIEAESTPIEDVRFTRCSFVDNAACGLVADSGDSRNLRFADCRFVGTTSWSAWPNKPGCRFSGCTFVGSVVHAFPDPDPSRAAQFLRCTFTDDPSLSPTRKVYTGGGPIVNLAQSENVLFDQCTFRLVASGLLPWSWKATYRDCRMTQRAATSANPKGRYLGRTTIQGTVDLYGSMIQGTVVLNGRQVPRGALGVPPW